MQKRNHFLEHLWTNRINAYMGEDWIDKEIQISKRHPNAPFADVGPILERLLNLGATRRELSLLARSAEYNGVFDTLVAIEEFVDVADFIGLHELVLSADPSGMEGRPGSAPEKAEQS